MTTLVVRGNYSQETLVLLAYLSQQPSFSSYANRYVVYIDTGWSGEGWSFQVERGEAFAETLGFQPIRLHSQASFDDLVRDRGDFPSQKFQWCAGLLKGVPFINWLDEHDPAGEWVIALPKRQALARTPIPERIEACPYHGERSVMHPIHALSTEECQSVLSRYHLQGVLQRSLECDPCVNLRAHEIAELKDSDIEKTSKLENSLNKKLFSHDIQTQVKKARASTREAGLSRDSFNRGCGDPFGCGL
ncbi:MAG: hypothetical protein U1E78_10290 [Gammaproteobacteria bacterium]